jgi:hypothetical protein
MLLKELLTDISSNHSSLIDLDRNDTSIIHKNNRDYEIKLINKINLLEIENKDLKKKMKTLKVNEEPPKRYKVNVYSSILQNHFNKLFLFIQEQCPYCFHFYDGEKGLNLHLNRKNSACLSNQSKIKKKTKIIKTF